MFTKYPVFTKLFLIPIFSVIFFACTRTDPQRNVSTPPSLTEDKAEKNSVLSDVLSVDSLRSRTYDATLLLDPPHRTTSKFVSSVASYQSDGLKLFTLLNIPTTPKPTSGYPVVIVNHGYIPPSQFSTKNSYINTSAFYADNGFVVLKPDYRGHAGSEGEPSTAAARVNYAVDVLNLLSAVQKLDYVDKNRIYMYGHSMGGDVTLRVLEVTNQVRAASLWAPAVAPYPESILYFARKNNQADRLSKLLDELSRLFPNELFDGIDVTKNSKYLNTPLVIHHGTKDESVPYKWGTNLVDLLKKENKSVEFYGYPNANHDISQAWSTALNRDIQFFNSNK